ncbi:hypothetical protein M513_10722 [Trichuris suis]|uniref:Uncharacterized protein n=1 Tax=Trichuris suis TaxID=68888 RepID=A0A085LTX6_9BILA|nr:hypothetical protein M513_10722 [Trichuris suis]
MELRRPGVEPGSSAWKATMLTATPSTRWDSPYGQFLSKHCKPMTNPRFCDRKRPIIIRRSYYTSLRCLTTRALMWLQGERHHVAARPDSELRRPGVEPGSIAWKATMLTATPSTR